MPSTPSSATPEPRRGLLAAIVVGVVALVAAVLVVVLVASGGSDADSGTPATPARNAGGRGTVVEPGPAEVGAAAPGFVLPGLSGGDVGLADFAGKPVVVNFWASWCNPCRKEFPLLKAARTKHAQDGLEIIGVSYRDIASDSRAFVADQGADWAFARDPDGKLAAAYGVRAVPQTFFIDADGTIVSRVFGITSAKDLDAEIQKILPDR